MPQNLRSSIGTLIGFSLLVKNINPIWLVFLYGFNPLCSIIFVSAVIAHLIFSLIEKVSFPLVSLTIINILFSKLDVNLPNNNSGFSVLLLEDVYV